LTSFDEERDVFFVCFDFNGLRDISGPQSSVFLHRRTRVSSAGQDKGNIVLENQPVTSAGGSGW
jgi:hypothetical protein